MSFSLNVAQAFARPSLVGKPQALGGCRVGCGHGSGGFVN